MIKPIQYLRGIAALMVVWFHGLSQVHGVSDSIDIPSFGSYGVDIFFVISGFIMTVTTWHKPITPREFFVLRIIRVVPLYWLVTIAAIVLATAAPGSFRSFKFDAVSIAKSLFFVPYSSLSEPGKPYPILVPGWTLNYEMFFYVLFAASLTIPSRWRLGSLVITLAALVTAGAIYGTPNMPVLVYTDPMLLEFAAGMIIGRVWLRGEHPSLALCVAGIVIGSIGIVFNSLASSWVVDNRVILMFAASLIVAGSLHPRICAIKNTLLYELGNASYSIYLTHLFTLGALRSLWVRFVPGMSLTLAVVFMMFAMISSAIAGWLCYRFIEKPVTTKLHRKASQAPALEHGSLAPANGVLPPTS